MKPLIAAGALGVAAALSVAAALLAPPLSAQTAQSCGREYLGIVACFAGKLCECVYDRGGLVTGTPPGFRWDCGVLRPGCGDTVSVPATINPYPGPYPLSVGIDRSDRSITVDQNAVNTNVNADGKREIKRPRPWRHRPEGRRLPHDRDDRSNRGRVGAPVPLQPPD